MILATREDVLRVPTEAVLEGPLVLVYDEDKEILVERNIETGLSNWRFTEVIGGLEAGARVVTSVDREGVTAGAAAVPERPKPRAAFAR